MTTYLILSFVLALALTLFIYSLFSSRIHTTDVIMSQNSNLSPTMAKALQIFGGDIYSLIPEKIKRGRRTNHTMERLFITSANPWKVTQVEFLILQILLALAGFIVSVLMYILLGHILPLMGIVLLGCLITFIGWYYPLSFYKGRSANRISAYKTDLPEAIDYLVISLSGGSTGLPAAINRIIKYLPEKSVMREEFSKIMDDIDSGKSIYEALDAFSKRAPTESIEAFVKALNSANKMSTPLTGILRARAEASRKDLAAEIDKKITTLPTRVMLVFGPISYISIIIIAIAPAAYSVMNML